MAVGLGVLGVSVPGTWLLLGEWVEVEPCDP